MSSWKNPIGDLGLQGTSWAKRNPKLEENEDEEKEAGNLISRGLKNVPGKDERNRKHLNGNPDRNSDKVSGFLCSGIRHVHK